MQTQDNFGSNWAQEHLLPSIQFSEQDKKTALLADLVCRHYGLVKLFGDDARNFIGYLLVNSDNDHYKSLLIEKYMQIKYLPLEQLEKFANESKGILILALHLTGECQMNCGICYTDRKKRSDELTWPEIEKVLTNAKKLGAKTIYVAGEGEPLLDSNFLGIARWCKENGLKFHVFTNGLALSRAEDGERFCLRNGINVGELKEKHNANDVRLALVKELSGYPIYFYYKLWSTEPKVHRKLTGIEEQRDHEWINYSLAKRNVLIPYGLKLLIENWSSERIGIQTTPTALNWQDVLNNIIPLIESYALRSYLEPLIHSGRNECHKELDLNDEQNELFTQYYVRQNCIRVRWKQVMSSTGICLPALSINSNDLARGLGLTTMDLQQALKQSLSIRKENGAVVDLFEMRFVHPLFAKALAQLAYTRGCVCETFFQDQNIRYQIRKMIEMSTIEAELRARGVPIVPNKTKLRLI